MAIRKTTAATFEKRTRRIAIAHHAQRAAVLGDEGRLTCNTPAGLLHIWPNCMPTRKKHEGFFTVFCRFEHPDAVTGAARRDMNPYSGKVNFHLSGGDADVEHAIEAFGRHLAFLITHATKG